MYTQNEFITQVEREARDMISNAPQRSGGLNLTNILEQEMALTIEQIDRLRDLRKNQFHSLLQTECYVDTDMMQMEARMPQYSHYRFIERDKFHVRLMAIEAERRRHNVFYNDKMQALQQKLLSLMQKHGQLSIHKYVRNVKY